MQRPTQMFNQFASQNEAMLVKSLNSASNSGGPLIPEFLRDAITNTVIRLSPMMAMVSAKYSDHGKTYRFNRRTSAGRGGSAAGEKATLRTRSSTLEDATVDLKILKSKIQVTNFLRNATKSRLDAALYELNSGIEAHVWDLEWMLIHGSELSNVYAFGGLNRFVTTNRIQYFNTGTGVATKPTDTSLLDNMINRSNRKGGAKHRRAFVMTPELASLFSTLQGAYVRQVLGAGGQMFVPIQMEGGWTMMSYKGIPIIESSFLSGIGADTMGAVGSSQSTGGTLADATYYFRVAKVTQNGESMSAAKSQVVNAGSGTASVVLTFTADEEAQSYRVYYAAANNLQDYRLIREVKGHAYDSDGLETSDVASITLLNVTADSSITTAMQSDLPLTANSGVNGEVAFLWDLDEIQGLGDLPYINDDGSELGGLVSVEQLARTEDWLDWMIKSYTALAPAFESTSVMVRGVAAA